MRLKVLFCTTLILFTSPLFGEPVPDQLIGTVNVRNIAKLDAHAKKEISSIAAKIKKIRSSGSVKITGNVANAKSPEEYISNSVFIAQLVETYIKTLLSPRFQTFITASKFTENKVSSQNSIVIYLYPYELKVEGAGFISTMTTPGEMLKSVETNTTTSQPVTYPVDSSPASSQLTPPVSDYDQVELTSKKDKIRIDNEDPVLANELVNKAKARAAQKAKRLEHER
ncbi:MAG: hypothetical protein HXX17_01325 [Geobacteraceae bacterium]|nr:hypothetical protein [Geobacteraceae bacterium]